MTIKPSAVPTLVPAVLVPNKLLLATSPDSAQKLRFFFKEHFYQSSLKKPEVPLGSYQIDVYDNRGWNIFADTHPSDESGSMTVSNLHANPSSVNHLKATAESLEHDKQVLEKKNKQLLKRNLNLKSKLAEAEKTFGYRAKRKLARLTNRK